MIFFGQNGGPSATRNESADETRGQIQVSALQRVLPSRLPQPRPPEPLLQSGPENTRRVQEWRAGHPGYERRKSAQIDKPLQEACSAQAPAPKALAPPSPPAALQDLCLMQPAVLVGLISTMTGSALQEDIARSARSFLARGHDILGTVPGAVFFPNHENQTDSLSPTAPARAAPV